MIHRESPRASATSANKNEAPWPPKSPHEALLSSPSGRKKFEQRRDDTQLTASPVRRKLFGQNAMVSPSSSATRTNGRAPAGWGDGDDEDEDDEETLQLKLQAIEAKLKLRKLQNKSREAKGEPVISSSATLPATQPHSSRRRARSPAASSVQVPVSPGVERRVLQDPLSPARVMLGIDKGLRARDVSLKRASSTVPKASASLNAARPSRMASTLDSRPSAKLSSFSERMSSSRTSDRDKIERERRIASSRSQGFNIGSARETSPVKSVSSGKSSTLAPSITLSAEGTTSNLQRHHSTPNLSMPHVQDRGNSSSRSRASSRLPSSTPAENHAGEQNEQGNSIFDSFSGMHLTRRGLSHSTLTRALEGKELFPISRLLGTVRGPKYEAPDVEADYVVFGVIASKSTPREHKQKTKGTTDGDPNDLPRRAKFMAIRLSDFKYEIDLYLFDSAFDAFWNIPPGTVIAVLNPGIMPPRAKFTDAFGLKLASSELSLIEIGTSRDLGFCKSLKGNGQECSQYLDKRKTDFCEFHVSLAVDKSKRGRMEVNTMAGSGHGSKGDTKASNRFGGRDASGKWKDKKGLLPEGAQYNAYLQETLYVLPKQYSSRPNSAATLDGDFDQDAIDRGCSRAELRRKRMVERGKEQELVKKLAATGAGMGGEYMRLRAQDPRGNKRTLSSDDPAFKSQQTASNASQDTAMLNDVASMGLEGKRAADVHLSPVKRKRSQALQTPTEPVGWAGASKRGILSPTKKLSGRTSAADNEDAPAPKKARFMLERGIREPGRESLGNISSKVDVDGADDDDDDDDLVVI